MKRVVLMLAFVVLFSACRTTKSVQMTADMVYADCKFGYIEEEGWHVFKGPSMYGFSPKVWNSATLLKSYKKGKQRTHMVSVSHPHGGCFSPQDAYDEKGLVMKVVMEEEMLQRGSKKCMGERFSAVISEKYLLEHKDKDMLIKFVGSEEVLVTIPKYYTEGYVKRLRKEGFLK